MAATEKKNDGRFQKGNLKQQGNPTRKRIRRSKLRKTYEELYKLEPKCLKIIKASVEGNEVDKETIATSKWVVQQLQSLNRAAVQEEIEINNLRWKADALGDAEEAAEREAYRDEDEEEEVSPRFSLHVLPTNKDLE